MHNLTWADAYGANFKKLSPLEVEVWESEIRDRIKDLREGEALRAVRKIAELIRTGEWKLRQMVSANHIISVIIKNRYEDRTGHLGHTFTKQEDFLNAIKAKMRHADEFYMRWNIMCQPTHYAGMSRDTTTEECDILCAWAFEMWPDEWHRPAYEEIGAFPQ